MPKLDDATAIGRALKPAERLRLIERLWESLSRDDWPGADDRELAEVRRHWPDNVAERMESVPWPIVQKMVADATRAARPKIYSAPRRFDLAMVFVVTTVYAVLFAMMSALQFPAVVSLAIAGFVTFVGVGQALLFGGREPRTASLIVGTTLFLLSMLAGWIISGPRAYPAALLLLIGSYTAIGGAILGYLSGALVGAVFLLADVVRRRFSRKASRDDREAPHG